MPAKRKHPSLPGFRSEVKEAGFQAAHSRIQTQVSENAELPTHSWPEPQAG